MSVISPIFLFSVIYLSLIKTVNSDCDSCYMHQYVRKKVDQKFEQKNTRFWELSEETNAWVEVKLPYDLISCINDNCTVVNTIQEPRKEAHKDGDKTDGSDQRDSLGKNKKDDDGGGKKQEKKMTSHPFLPVRKRISLTKMSERSIWVTGESGSVYERFWNGMQWVIAPHALPVDAGYGVSAFLVNNKILALSEAGHLYQMRLNEDTRPIWVQLLLESYEGTGEGTIQSSKILLSNGVISNDGKRVYFCTKDGQMLEFLEIDPPSLTVHGRPPGANVAAITDAATIRPGLLFIVSSAGDLYEYDQMSKPPWKKHIRSEGSTKDTALESSSACTLHGLVGTHSVSLFFLTKGGELIERRLHQRKWKWVVHGNPNGHVLSSITCVAKDESNENPNSLFVTTASGFVFQYHIQKHPAITSQNQDVEENWLSHNHPPHARVARGVVGQQFQAGRMIFPLDDGRLAELHLSGLGGESVGPNAPPISPRRKSLLKYVWSILDAPESEGWNAEHCTMEHGPSNCMEGTKDEGGEVSVSRWRKDGKAQQSYLVPSTTDIGSLSALGQGYERVNKLFRLRAMHEGKSFFLVTDDGGTFECLNDGIAWVWLRHEHPTGFEGVLGKYNGSLYLVDGDGSLVVRERSGDDLVWMNCTSMRRGKPVIGGPPWDGVPGRERGATLGDAIFFVSKSGTLLQFNVALRNFKWKDCKTPPGTKITSIVDQEGFRDNVVFVIDQKGRLYQYNKVSRLWHQHYKSQHLVLSRSPGTSVRPSPLSLKGSIFMLSEDGGLVEYQWSPTDGWNWIEHGQPRSNVTLVGAPGPCFGGTALFLVGSDGNVYLRYLDQGEWKWRVCEIPFFVRDVDGNEKRDAENGGNGEMCHDSREYGTGFGFEKTDEKIDENCNHKVSSTRPIAFSEDSVIFELQDGRLAEMTRVDDRNWIWSRTIATPTTLCNAKFWTSWA